MIITNECQACGQCLEYCPHEAIKILATNGYGQCYIDQELCVNCLSCLEVDCPGEAIINEK